MSRIVFVDTETTSLRPDRRAWDVALIVREPGSDDREFQWFIEAQDLDLGNADPFSLRIGHYYDRHPAGASPDLFVPHVQPEAFVMRQVEYWTRGAHLVGAVPNFDADVLGTRMRANGILPSWHYHLIDVEALTVGWINGCGARAADEALMRDEDPQLIDRGRCAPPWDSAALSEAIGVKREDGHTAIGDARWARDIYDKVMGVRS